jgi:hypothetical protein
VPAHLAIPISEEEFSMEIPKEQILQFLQERGSSDEAAQADQELPETVDTEQDAGLLSKFGIDPQELIGKFGSDLF